MRNLREERRYAGVVAMIERLDTMSQQTDGQAITKDEWERAKHDILLECDRVVWHAVQEVRDAVSSVVRDIQDGHR